MYILDMDMDMGIEVDLDVDTPVKQPGSSDSETGSQERLGSLARLRERGFGGPCTHSQTQAHTAQQWMQGRGHLLRVSY